MMPVVEGVLSGSLVAGVLLLLGSPLLYRGWKHRSRYQRFQDLAIESPARAPSGEPVLITGTAKSTGEDQVTPPLSDDQALFAAWDIHSLRRYHPLGVRWVWAQEALGVQTSEFEVHGDGERLTIPDWTRHVRIEGKERMQLSGTGQLPVNGLDVKNLWVEIDGFDTEERILPTETVPDRLQDLGARAGFPSERPGRLLPTLPWLRTPEGTLRYRETTIEDGQDITVLGSIQEKSEGPQRLIEPAEYPALVSPLDPATLIKCYRWSYWKSVYGLLLIIVIIATAAGIGVAM